MHICISKSAITAYLIQQLIVMVKKFYYQAIHTTILSHSNWSPKLVLNSLRRRLGISRSELERYTVNAMAFIRGCTEAFSFEDVAKVSTAGCARDLYPMSIRIRLHAVPICKICWLLLQDCTGEEKENLQFGLWPQGVPRKRQANRSGSWIWLSTCRGEFHILHIRIRPPQIACHIYQYQETWSYRVIKYISYKTK